RNVTLDILDARGRLIRSFSSKQDSITRADSLKVDALKKTRTDSLKQAGITDSTKIDSILGVLFDTLKDEDKPWPHRPAAAPRVEAGVTRAPAAADAARALLDKLDRIEDGLYQVHSQADEDALVYPPGPTERISGLILGASAGDARPTAQTYDVFRLFAPQIQQ